MNLESYLVKFLFFVIFRIKNLLGSIAPTLWKEACPDNGFQVITKENF
jgi:hypothetical protein